MLNAEKLTAYELCPRRYHWTGKYAALRVSLIRALYIALDAGLCTDKDPEKAAENEFLALAARPGLDVTGHDVYAVAMHTAKLAGILAAALRSTSTAPWKPFPAPDGWESACYDMGDGKPRRIALVDRWSDDRKQQEINGWRTIGEACWLEQPVFLTAIEIGAARDKRRHSAWTRCYRHPRNRAFRFMRKGASEDFGANWETAWREDAGIPTAAWLTKMREDGCMADLVHTTLVPVPVRRGDYMAEMARLGAEMERGSTEMRLAGCYGFSPCVFGPVCHGAQAPDPESYGFRCNPQKQSL